MKKIKAFRHSYFILLLALLTLHTNAQILPIQPFTLYSNDGHKVIELGKEGDIHVFEEPVGRLLQNGQVQDMDGNLLATLDKDGFLKDYDQKILGKLLADGSWDNGSGSLQQFNKDGQYTIRDDLFLELEPNDKNVYKSANLLVVLTFYITTTKTIPVTEPASNPEIVLYLSQSPGGPGTQSYEYTVYADGKVSTPGYSHATTRQWVTQEDLTTLLEAAKDIDIAALGSNAKPLPFVHDGQVIVLKLRQDGILYTIYGVGSREAEVYINYVRRFMATSLKSK